jgi:hypothetical protein
MINTRNGIIGSVIAFTGIALYSIIADPLIKLVGAVFLIIGIYVTLKGKNRNIK